MVQNVQAINKNHKKKCVLFLIGAVQHQVNERNLTIVIYSCQSLLFFQAVQQLTYQAEKKKKEWAIVQQTVGITDNVAACINVHTIDLICTIVFAVEH